MWWFRGSLRIRWRHAPPKDRCSICGLYFWWFRRDSLHAISNLHDSSQHRNISCNVQIERLMFCKVIRHNATPFVCTLYHSTLRLAISRNSTAFVCTLYYSTLRWAISRSATPFVCTLYHSTFRWAISRNATLFVCTLYHWTLRWAISRNATPFVRTLCYSKLHYVLHCWCTVL